jgi:hypothetical protein
MNEHQKFEILCAAVVVGQVSDADLQELKRHLAGCFDCQNRVSDFAQISAQALPLSGEKYGQPRSPKAMTTRFVEQARDQGIPLRDPELLLPSDLSFGLSGWTGSLAASLLLIAIIAGGISKSAQSRTQSADVATTAKLQLPVPPSAPTNITQNRSAQPRTNPLPVPRQTRMLNARSGESARTPTPRNSHRENASLRPAQVFQSIQHPATQCQSKLALDRQVFSCDLTNEHSRLFPTYDRSSGRPWFDGSSRMPFIDRNLLANAADPVDADPRERAAAFATVSLNVPLRGFSFWPDRSLLSDSPRNRSESTPNIDWYQVWLMRAESLRNATDSSPSHPGVLLPEWPFSQASKGDQR